MSSGARETQKPNAGKRDSEALFFICFRKRHGIIMVVVVGVEVVAVAVAVVVVIVVVVVVVVVAVLVVVVVAAAAGVVVFIVAQHELCQPSVHCASRTCTIANRVVYVLARVH